MLLGIVLSFVLYLYVCSFNKKKQDLIYKKSSWIKNADELYKEQEEKYLKEHKRKISPEAARIYNEQLAIYKQNMKKDSTAGLTAKWFEEAIKNCDMQKATMFCQDLWEHHDAKLFLNEYIMTNLFKIHDYYE